MQVVEKDIFLKWQDDTKSEIPGKEQVCELPLDLFFFFSMKQAESLWHCEQCILCKWYVQTVALHGLHRLHG